MVDLKRRKTENIESHNKFIKFIILLTQSEATEIKTSFPENKWCYSGVDQVYKQDQTDTQVLKDECGATAHSSVWGQVQGLGGGKHC